MPELVHLPADAPTATMAEVLDRDGALILDRVLTPEAVAGMVAELSPYVAATPAGRDGFTGVRTTRTGALVARSPAVRDAVTDPRIARMCQHLLKANCERWQLHLTQLIRIMPGQGAQPIHRDRWAWGAHLKGIEPQLNTIWALTDFTRENGATQVVPGSSAWPDDRKVQPHEITQAVMKA
ncbi:MAG: phytanoyl-CoA dioxygenase family protein, partial [Phenylobacterium sp.]|nr:phytanoyl-CoA dioxygenase family protein [Phenylobacterium sp.]